MTDQPAAAPSRPLLDVAAEIAALTYPDTLWFQSRADNPGVLGIHTTQDETDGTVQRVAASLDAATARQLRDALTAWLARLPIGCEAGGPAEQAAQTIHDQLHNQTHGSCWCCCWETPCRGIRDAIREHTAETPAGDGR
jgi:hypothetical protein